MTWVFIGGIALLAGGNAWAGVLSTLRDDVSWSGYFKNETAYRYREPRSFTKIRNIVSVDADYRFGSRYALHASGWAYYDVVYDLFDYRTISARAERDIIQPLAFIENLEREEDNRVVDLREFYLDIEYDRMDVRIGRQYVVWGVLTGVRVVDEINPMDFRELILLDLMDYRIPLWKLRVDYYGENNTYQLLWIPDLRFHKPAPRGSEWELLQDITDEDGNNIMNYPPRTFENSEFGFRVQRMIGMTELALSYFYTWDDFPVLFRRVPVDAGAAVDPQFFPTYTRIHMYGLTFQRPFFNQVIKGEAAYVQDKFFGTADIDRDGDGFLDNLGELRRDHIRWGIGLDFNIWRTDFSLGLTQWVILDYAPEIIQDEYDTALNLFVRKEIPERRAVFTLLGIGLINLKEGYLKPKITFDLTDKFQVGVGADLFWGEKSQQGVAFEGGRPTNLIEIDQRSRFLGNFSENDRLFVEFKYAF
jgi:hypothetical protein